jgi:bifunctional non-homologous end joining protein LigD
MSPPHPNPSPSPSAPALDGVELTHLDQPVFDGAGVTKGELVDYLAAVANRMLPALRDRPLSVIRARPGQPPFMQKNLPRYAPEWIARVEVPSGAGRTTVYPLCHDRRTLVWLANRRAIEYHPTLARIPDGRVTELVVDLDPPQGSPFLGVARAAGLVRETVTHAGLTPMLKSSGAKGLHVVVPVAQGLTLPDAAAATRALAARAARLDPALMTTEYLLADRGGRVYLDPTRSGSASLAAVYSPRARPGLPVSFPLAWQDLESFVPGDVTIRTAPALLGEADPWHEGRPEPIPVPQDLVDEGHRIPVPRVVAMHEGKRRRAAARRAGEEQPG